MWIPIATDKADEEERALQIWGTPNLTTSRPSAAAPTGGTAPAAAPGYGADQLTLSQIRAQAEAASLSGGNPADPFAAILSLIHI